ncbi:hypothetical protein CDAR_419021 [Caerostris darwini]|uniref:Uncharacterized protein n=1 Tax=Caerostris darwini TaxID=1538125 RepID=A0AAV4MYD3_9ARAC|nr:hypothetical protein CDAR_419021 [Caerostris darwini]
MLMILTPRRANYDKTSPAKWTQGKEYTLPPPYANFLFRTPPLSIHPPLRCHCLSKGWVLMDWALVNEPRPNFLSHPHPFPAISNRIPPPLCTLRTHFGFSFFFLSLFCQPRFLNGCLDLAGTLWLVEVLRALGGVWSAFAFSHGSPALSSMAVCDFFIVCNGARSFLGGQFRVFSIFFGHICSFMFFEIKT